MRDGNAQGPCATLFKAPPPDVSCIRPPSFPCVQASITALPPPELWNNHVLAYFSSMSPDRYRGLIRDLQLKICDLLPPAAQCSLEHSSYQHISNVRPPTRKKHGSTVIAYAYRLCRYVWICSHNC